jgi:membrane protease YdiL (CAAX protease family)
VVLLADEVPKKMNTNILHRNRLLPYFLLVFALSVPLWVIGATELVALPVGTALYIPNLLWHISLALLPMSAALILVYRDRGSAGVRHLLKRPFDEMRIPGKIWYVPIFLLFPVLMVLVYELLRLRGVVLPDLQFPGLTVSIFFVLFFALGIGEELGWTGYALGPLQDRWNALGASLILGIVSLLWHLVPRMEEPHTPTWIVWHSAHGIPLRVLMVWLYNSTGQSMFSVVAFHATVNIGEVVWPFIGTTGAYDPFLTTVLLTITAAIVIFLWGPKTLAQYRYARPGS